MYMLVKNLQPRLIFNTHRFLIANQARQAHWLPDYKPGPVPDTKEKAKAAAKKYNLLPEEYEPYEEDEIGDYPKLPFESVDSRDPYYPWDYPELRKNFNDPIEREIMSVLPLGISTVRQQKSTLLGLSQCIAIFTVAFSFFYFLSKMKLNSPSCEKQYPTPGVIHYTFDIGEDNTEFLRQQKLKECMEKAGFPVSSPATQ